MTNADLPFADSLRQLAGWNQTLDDWRRLLAHDPSGCFVAEWQGEPVGTITTTKYGPELAWIGMLLVHPERRRLGIGTALLRQAISHLEADGVSCVKLDATPEGQPLYARMGFKCEWGFHRWERVGPPPRSSPQRNVRPLTAVDTKAIQQLDATALGVPRQRWLSGMLQNVFRGVVSETAGQITGFGLLREGARALYLGPIVATNPAETAGIIAALLSQCAPQRLVFWDVPERNTPAVRFARELQFKQQRSLVRMFRGQSPLLADLARLFGIAGPEVG
jgi:GNAT superfamily N-acetyltransferase